MRESNVSGPPQNRAVTVITQMVYDRRALDTNSPLALLNSLTALTSLTSTSARIREMLTVDGGLERLLDILRESCLPKDPPAPPQDLWGLNGPPTARVITMERANSLKHSLAFQCVVNIGVRGSEVIRTRVVQSGALDLVAQILESWLKEHGVSIFAGPLGSQAAVDAAAKKGAVYPAEGSKRHKAEREKEKADKEKREKEKADRTQRYVNARANYEHMLGDDWRQMLVPQAPEWSAAAAAADAARAAEVASELAAQRAPAAPAPAPFNFGIFPEYRTSGAGPSTAAAQPQQDHGMDTDVDMADAEGGETTDASMDGDDMSIDVDPRADDELEPTNAAPPPAPNPNPTSPQPQTQAQPSTTPRASNTFLPMTIPTNSRVSREREGTNHAAGIADSLSGEESAVNTGIPRITSESNIAVNTQGMRPPALNLGGLGVSRVPQLAQDPTSTQSSPMGTPPREGGESSNHRFGRRGTIVARQATLAPRSERRGVDATGGAGSGTSDGGEDIDLPTATIAANIAAVGAHALETGGPVVGDEPAGPPPNLEIIETTGGQDMEDPDPEAIAEEQARLDLEAGAPPGQPGAAQTPRTTTVEATTPRAATTAGGDAAAPPADQAQIIVANGAPRAFHDLGSYVGISSLLNPDGNKYSDDSILLALQLLAYLSKYPHVRTGCHHPRRPIHHTFDLGNDNVANPLPERPAYSETPDIFSLVQRLTFRPSMSDPGMFKVPNEIQYWAGVIMRNACRKDDAKGGIRQCASMSCGKWEKYSREFSKCRSCKKAKYCSKTCQSRAWQEGHRFWCCPRPEQEPAAVAASAANIPRPEGGEDDEDYRIGLQMGLSAEVVSRALAAARTAGILPIREQAAAAEAAAAGLDAGAAPVAAGPATGQPGQRPPRAQPAITPNRNSPAPAAGPAGRFIIPQNDVTPTRPTVASPAQTAQLHANPHRRAPAGDGEATQRVGADAWARFQNVGAMLGLRQGQEETQGQRDFGGQGRLQGQWDPQVDGPVVSRAQRLWSAMQAQRTQAAAPAPGPAPAPAQEEEEDEVRRVEPGMDARSVRQAVADSWAQRNMNLQEQGAGQGGSGGGGGGSGSGSGVRGLGFNIESRQPRPGH
ncbi:hypothetical protein IAT38_002305 [Cryptococcus sp. DSM 104549]